MNIQDVSQTITTIYIIATVMAIVGFLIALGGYFLSNSTSSEKNPKGNVSVLAWGVCHKLIMLIIIVLNYNNCSPTNRVIVQRNV